MSKTIVLVILGSGLYDLYSRKLYSPKNIHTSFGSAAISEIRNWEDPETKVFVMMRHGLTHSLPPHLINYRANIAAAKKLGVDFILATASVGSLSRDISIGSYVVLDQFLDFTKNRADSVYFDTSKDFVHTDMTQPFSRVIRSALIRSLRINKARYVSKGTYVCTQGPRFETPAEIKMYRKMGGDVVGMTCVPEVVIAGELQIPYGSLCHVTNLAAGMQKQVTQAEVNFEMKKSLALTKQILNLAIARLRDSS